MIISKVISYIGSLLIVIFTLYTIIFSIIRFCSKWKCRKKHYDVYYNRCHESKCKYASYCENYQHIYTDKEIKELYEIIENYQA